jgi:hypothetical protein
MPSILTGHYGRQLSGRVIHVGMASDVVSMKGTGRYAAWDFRVRHGRTIYGRSGGAVVSVEFQHPLLPGQVHRFSRKLKKGWSIRNLENAFTRCFDEAMVENARLNAVQLADVAARRFGDDETFLDAVAVEEARRGKDSCYDVMTVDEASEWVAWIAEWARRRELAA